MAGGVLQLFAYGAEDIYLTENPQITFFKTVFRRHTNFSIQTFERDILEDPGFGKKSVTKIFRLGDLMHKMVLRVRINGVIPNEGARFAWVRRLGHAIIRNVKIEIGGQCIDKNWGIWLDIWYELTRGSANGLDRGYRILIGDVPEMTTLSSRQKPEYNLYIPMRFYFNRNQGLALPLIAIQYSELYFHVEFNTIDKLFVSTPNFTNTAALSIQNASLLIDYVYLEKIERERFAQFGHDYLIEQVQFDGEDPIEREQKRIQLFFNYPTKELIWAMRNGNYTTGKKFLCYSNLDDWSDEVLKCSINLLRASQLLLRGPTFLTDEDGNLILDQYGNRIVDQPGVQPPPGGNYEEFQPDIVSFSDNNKLRVDNQSTTMSLWIDTGSLKIGNYLITAQIGANITVTPDNRIILDELTEILPDRAISFPIDELEDFRQFSDDICVNQCTNYGLFITGKGNPIESSQLDFNDQERFNRRRGNFFNYLQPEMHHTATPADGINVYSFALHPEEHQPSGTANLSKIEKIILRLWFSDIFASRNEQPINIVNPDSRLFIFGFNYNILRIQNGLVSLVYTD